MNENTRKPTAIVTGAGSGVGRDLALLLAEEGLRVVMVARTESKLREAEAFIRSEGTPTAELEVRPCDVSDSHAVKSLVDGVAEAFGGVDYLANVAGAAPIQPIERIEDDALRANLAVNFESVVYLTRACWPYFKKQKAGAVCNVSSMAAFDPFRGFNMYGAAKAAVNLFTKATADEGQRLGIRAAAVAPGAIETPMLRQNFSTKAIPETNTLDPLDVAAVIRDVLLGRREVEPGGTIQMPSPH
ncbi:MAG: SDR family oxidoreductase [Planctomycetota bacterium]